MDLLIPCGVLNCVDAVMIGETAMSDRGELKARKVEPVRQIVQPPPRPSQVRFIHIYLNVKPTLGI